MLWGFLVGCAIGLIQPCTLGLSHPNLVYHGILTLEMGLAFGVIGFLLSRYRDVRSRVRGLLEGEKRTR